METLNFYFQLLSKAFDWPFLLFDAVSLFVHFSNSIPSKLRKHWGDAKVVKIYEFLKKYALWAFVVMVLIGLVTAPYRVFTDMQKENIAFLEAHRPMLSVRHDFLEKGIQVYPETRHINFKINHILKNTGDRPAYQVKTYVATAPLDEPEAYKFNYKICPNALDPDPDYEYVVEHIFGGEYSLRNDLGIVMIYLRVEYSNSLDGELYPLKEIWTALTIPLNESEPSTPFIENEPKFSWPEPEWIELHRPYIEKLLRDD